VKCVRTERRRSYTNCKGQQVSSHNYTLWSIRNCYIGRLLPWLGLFQMLKRLPPRYTMLLCLELLLRTSRGTLGIGTLKKWIADNEPQELWNWGDTEWWNEKGFSGSLKQMRFSTYTSTLFSVRISALLTVSPNHLEWLEHAKLAWLRFMVCIQKVMEGWHPPLIFGESASCTYNEMM